MRTRTFCEAMDQDPAMMLTALDELGYNRTSKLRQAAARMRQEYEMTGSCDAPLILSQYDIDTLTREEIVYLEDYVNG